MLLFIHLAMVLVFIVLGIIFLKGKGSFLISGYNTASESEKAKTDEKKLCDFMGKLMLVLAACWLVIAASAIFGTMTLYWAGLALFITAVAVGIIYANTGDRFRK